MKEKQKNSGITLIALIITIIVLLILAGIVINLALGQNGIMVRGEEAGIEYDIAHEKEILGLALKDIQIQNGGSMIIPDEATLEKAMKDNSGMEGITAKKSSEKLYIVTYPDSKRQYEVYADGTVQDAAPKINDDTPGEIAKKDENTYLIQSIEDLVILSNTANDGTDTYEGKTFEIVTDLNFASVNSYIDATSTVFGDINGNEIDEPLITELTTGAGFKPIGNYFYDNGWHDYSFKGNIEGAGHTISNLYINRNGQYQGFIGYYSGTSTSIQNLKLTNVDIGNDYYTAAFIGYTNSSKLVLNNCVATGIIKGKTTGGIIASCSSYSDVTVTNSHNEAKLVSTGKTGGIVADPNYSSNCSITIDNCYNSGEIISEGTGFVGGLVGYSCRATVVRNSYNIGNVTAINGNGVGGIVPVVQRVITIENCYNTGTIEGVGRVGGIAGGSEWISEANSTITRCYNIGTIISSEKKTDTSTGWIGGIVGYGSNVSITQCYNTGEILANRSCYVGGIAGDVSNQIQYCYNKGKVSGKTYVGGIAGKTTEKVENVYNIGNITSDNTNTSGSVYIGGIVGDAESEIKNAYNLGEITDKSPSASGINAGGIAGFLSGTIDNTYNLKRITYKSEEATKDIGAIIGCKSGTADLSTSYYLKGTYSAGAGYGTDASQVKDTEADMKEVMNANLATLEGWKEDEQNINNGYPLLDF